MARQRSRSARPSATSGNYEVIDREDGAKVGLGRFAHIWTADRNGGWRLDRDLWYERSE
jgi:hypothetical protein